MPSQGIDKSSGDFWDRLHWITKVVVAISVVWGASATSTLVAQKWSTVPKTLEGHDTRITVLESLQKENTQRTTSHFIYIGCMLQEIKEETEGSRCDLILMQEDRTLLRQYMGGQ